MCRSVTNSYGAAPLSTNNFVCQPPLLANAVQLCANPFTTGAIATLSTGRCDTSVNAYIPNVAGCVDAAPVPL